ncbi:putative aldouronate transport system substrate-binding protein [Paenibacillus sp. 1_12]|uniref:extracellular solute-binding protein n=1 Tax=Paenibacillus sp. 1_12 TaxID=1566278 RepID=UPI0008E5DAC3|nr:extracellular solute-binding protein [Paenibacillus sp. 1_12]SFL56371.1 putative aldouronate transport system substrate-binding protein [Paenibacillus sp. 1_12]
MSYSSKRFSKAKKACTAAITLSLLLSACGSATDSGSGDTTKTADATQPLKLKIMSSLWTDVPEMNNQFWTEVQKRTNTKLDVDWIPNTDYSSKLDLVLASGDLPEVMVATSEKYLPLVNAIKQGLFWDLTPYLTNLDKYPNLKKNVPASAWNYLKVNDKLYYLPRTRALVDQAPKYRKDWFDKLGIPEPTTVDELRTALKKVVSSDPDGNGKDDTIGIEFNDTYGGAFGMFDPAYNSEGGLINFQLNPAYTDMVEWYRGLYADGSMSKEFSVIKNVEEIFKTGRSATYMRNIYHDWTYEQELKKKETGAKVESIPALKGPKGYAVNITEGYNGAILISKKVPEDKMLRILDFFNQTAGDELSDLFYNGIKGVHYNEENGVLKPTDLGTKEVNISVRQFIVLNPNRWEKVVNPAATKEWNDAKIKKFEIQEKIGKERYYQSLVSDTWSKVWPKYTQEWESMRVKAIIGQISMDEYKKYVDKLNESADFKKAYQEFTTDYKRIFKK